MRWLFRLVGLILTLAVVGVAAVALIPSDQIAALAARQFQAATGRTIQITGAIRPSVWPRIGVTTGPVQIANAAWSDAGPMLTAQGLDIGLDLSAAIAGKLVIRNIDLQKPSLILERNAAGEGNWSFAPSAAQTSAETQSSATAPSQSPAVGPMPVFTLDHGTLTDGTLLWIDHASGQRLSLAGIAADVKIPALEGPADLALTAVLNGQKLTLAARISGLADTLAGRVAPLTLTVSGAGLAASFDGKAGLAPLMAEGAAEVSITDPDPLFAILGQPAHTQPSPLPKPLVVSGQATLTAQGTAHLRQGRLTVGPNVANVDADLFPTDDRPRLVAQIKTGALDLSPLLAQGGAAAPNSAKAAPSTAATPAGWSDAPIDVSALAALDAEVTLSAESIRAGDFETGQTDAVLRLDKARAVTDIAGMQVYGGLLTGQFVVNGRKGLSMGGALRLQGANLAPLLSATAGYARLRGTGSGDLKFLAVGDNLNALVRGLSGQGALTLGNGELDGLDLDAIVTTLDPTLVGKGSTVFDSLTASFAITDGVLANDDLAMQAPLLTASGKGRVDIGNRTLDYTIAPTLAAQGKALTVPIRISGPWSSPRIEPDLQGVIDANFAEEKARLKAGAEAKLAAEAAKLGIVPQAGESLEDAARRTAKEKARAELARAITEKLAPPPDPSGAATPDGTAMPGTAMPDGTAPTAQDLLKGLLLKRIGN